uniref:hypothetical protein n=1 Tax=Flammeovirga sp. OC4 TaxID=1382345 RepID=UPI0005C5FE28
MSKKKEPIAGMEYKGKPVYDVEAMLKSIHEDFKARLEAKLKPFQNELDEHNASVELVFNGLDQESE